MTRAQKQAAISELSALKDYPVSRGNMEDWLQMVTAKLRYYFPATNLAEEIERLFDPWISPNADAKKVRRMTFKQAVDSAKGTIGSIVAQLQAEVELCLDEDNVVNIHGGSQS